MDELRVEPQGAWVRLVMNRPAAKNALTTGLLAQLAQALQGLDEDPDCRAVMIGGAGGHFAAGADISEIETKSSADAASDPRIAHWAAIRGFSKPLVAVVDGFALGGGFELALMADLIVLGPQARLGLPETNLGLIPGAGGGQRLQALIGRIRAGRMIMLGEILPAEQAMSWGIASHLADDPWAEAARLCETLSRRAPLALRAAKAALLATEARTLALDAERAGFVALLDSHDKSEGIAAFRARRPPEFSGS